MAPAPASTITTGKKGGRMTYTFHARPCCGKSVWQVLDATIRYCAHSGLRILAIHRDSLCCRVEVEC